MRFKNTLKWLHIQLLRLYFSLFLNFVLSCFDLSFHFFIFNLFYFVLFLLPCLSLLFFLSFFQSHSGSKWTYLRWIPYGLVKRTPTKFPEIPFTKNYFKRDGMGREEGGGFRLENTCIPMADSCWCMAKPIL